MFVFCCFIDFNHNLTSYKQIPRHIWRGIVRENIGERTALSGCRQVMDA